MDSILLVIYAIKLRATHLRGEVSCSAEPYPNLLPVNKVKGSYFKPPSLEMFVSQQWIP